MAKHKTLNFQLMLNLDKEDHVCTEKVICDKN